MEPPRSESELLARAFELDGLSIMDLAHRLGFDISGSPLQTKGRIGELLEIALGASSGNLDQPDFPQLGIELKTIPIDRTGRVCESTFVCALDLSKVEYEEWSTSRVRRKLAHVLWIPIESARVASIDRRHIGTPYIWRMDPAEESLLQSDWNELVGKIAIGAIDDISAHLGHALQIRPKAANASVQVEIHGPERELLSTVPLGFYLRASFTQQLLWRLSPKA
ncbi:MAG: DNA mismatch repair endonuclease MutH [Pseudomonadota bacterium]